MDPRDCSALRKKVRSHLYIPPILKTTPRKTMIGEANQNLNIPNADGLSMRAYLACANLTSIITRFVMHPSLY